MYLLLKYQILLSFFVQKIVGFFLMLSYGITLLLPSRKEDHYFNHSLIEQYGRKGRRGRGHGPAKKVE